MLSLTGLAPLAFGHCLVVKLRSCSDNATAIRGKLQIEYRDKTDMFSVIYTTLPASLMAPQNRTYGAN